jgi:RNA polymerase sigma-70 factor, ECF subfamily
MEIAPSLHRLRIKSRLTYIRDVTGESEMLPSPVEIRNLATDPQAFADLTEPYRRELQVHSYRILGSVHEAEDMVQETMIKAWKRLHTYEGRASFRAWLYKIATNTCLDFLDSKRSRKLLPFHMVPASDPLSPVLPPPPEMAWLEPLPDEWLADTNAIDPEARYSESESISLSFLTALQILPPRQRAVLILRDVLDFSATETAEVLELTASSVNSLLHRARKTLAENYQSEPLMNRPSDEKTRWLLDRYVRAWKTADVDGLVALLKWDAIIAMPPSPSWYSGRKAIAIAFTVNIFGTNGMFTGKARDRWRLLPTHANGSPAFAIYQRAEEGYQSFGLQVLELSKDRIWRITNFIDPALPTRFGLPQNLK